MPRILKWLLPVFMLAMGAVVLMLLHHELKRYDYHAVAASLRSIPRDRIAIAIGLTILSYLVLTCYDAVAVHLVGRPLRYLRTAIASFTAYVLSYNVGFSVVSGTAVRFRLYGAWGFTANEIGRIVGFTGLTFWIGLFFAAGLLFTFGEVRAPESWPLIGGDLRPVGLVFLALVVAYLIAAALRKKPFVIRSWTLPLPGFPIALSQAALGAIDVTIAGLVGWVLMPAGWSFPNFLGVYLLGMTAGLISHVPGGLGVMETVLLYGRPDSMSGPAVLGALLAYRVIYYLLPLGGALGLLASHEFGRHRERIGSAAAKAGQWAPRIAPNVLSAATFVAGVILLFSGATPTAHERLHWLRHLVPLPVLEISHLLGSIVGVLLLFVARGLQRRLDGAYLMTVALLIAGAVFSILKGIDWEEAVILLAMLLLMLPSRDYFNRRASLLDARFTPGWIVAIIFVLGATIWLGFFAYRHVEYRNELWWRFAFHGDAPRFLRATVAALMVTGFIGLQLLLRPARVQVVQPDAATLERIAPIVAASEDSMAHLALVGDKALLFSASGRAFVMYAVEGRSWIAMGDPVGPEEEREELVWSFRELADRHGGRAVFYQVSTRDLPVYLDAGFTLTKVGEEARVELAQFTLEGPERKSLRHAYNHAQREGCQFEWIEKTEVPNVLPEVRAVSENWMAGRGTREKGFSLGFFTDEYLGRGPLALVRKDGRVVAFANVWVGAAKEELSIDLMRQTEDAPSGVMEFLFVNLMRRGAENGYEWFNLGMAPLAGMESRALAPLWQRLGALIFRHGESFYRFRGLHAYKEKYGPEWTPRYLAAPSRLSLPIVLANVTTLISGGVKGVVAK